MKQVISLDRLRRAKGWYEKPLTIKIHLSFKKSTLIIILLLAAIVYLVTRGQVAALTPPSIIKSSGKATVGSQIPLEQPAPTFHYYEDVIKARDERIAKEKEASRLRIIAKRNLLAKQKAEKQRAAEAAQAVINSQAVVTPKVYQAPAPVTNCGSDPYQQKIYSSESGCRLVNPNGSGCDGIGQACPVGKLIAACPDWQTNWNCQNNFFTGYMQAVYGTWANAWAMWQSRCGSPQGCWW